MHDAPFEPWPRQEALVRFDAKPSLGSNSTPVAAIRIESTAWRRAPLAKRSATVCVRTPNKSGW